MAADDILIAVESVLTEVDGENVYITEGDLAEAGAAIVKGREHLFEPITVKYKAETAAHKKAQAAADKAADKG
jgi:hypothetical protein